MVKLATITASVGGENVLPCKYAPLVAPSGGAIRPRRTSGRRFQISCPRAGYRDERRGNDPLRRRAAQAGRLHGCGVSDARAHPGFRHRPKPYRILLWARIPDAAQCRKPQCRVSCPAFYFPWRRFTNGLAAQGKGNPTPAERDRNPANLQSLYPLAPVLPKPDVRCR